MKYWKVRITINNQAKIIDDFYENITLDEEEILYKENEKSKDLSGKMIFSCAYEVDGQECGCKLNFKNTSEYLDTGHYTLAKLPQDNHKEGCLSDSEYLSEAEFLNDVDYKKIFSLLRQKEKDKYQIIGLKTRGSDDFLERSSNPLILDKPVKITKKKIINKHKILDYIFKRNQTSKQGYQVSGFEDENWKNTFWQKYYNDKELMKNDEEVIAKIRKRAFNFKADGIYKLNWNTIPLVFFEGGKNIIKFNIYSFYIEGNILDIYSGNDIPFSLKRLNFVIEDSKIVQLIKDEREKNKNRPFSLFFKEKINYNFKRDIFEYYNIFIGDINITSTNGLMAIYEDESNYLKLW